MDGWPVRLARAGLWALTLWLPIAFGVTFTVKTHAYNKAHPPAFTPGAAFCAMQNIGRCK